TEGLAHWREESARARAASMAAADEAAREGDRLPQAELALREGRERLAEGQRRLLVAEQTARLEESHRTHAQRAVQQLEFREARLTAERDDLPLPDAGELLQLHERVAGIAADLKRGQEALADAERRLP